MANILTSTPLLDQLKMFELLGTLQMNQLNPEINQWNHQYSVLLANQPGVPQATPAPGFEQRLLMAAPSQLLEQQICASTMPGYDYEEDELDIFNGEPNDASFNVELAKAALRGMRDIDTNQMPDLSVFEDFQDEGYNPSLEETYQPPSSPVLLKMEAKSPSPCGSECSYSSASPPHSPSISEASYNTYSTDEGFVSEDLSDLDEILDRMSSSGSPASIHSEPEKLPPVVVKEEVPEKKKRSKRGPKPPVKYRGDGPIQLWQFLLELIIGSETSHLVKWTQEEDYEFKILQPAIVAKMWGKKKNKPTMNYEKLSRGLRYYYGKNIIEKVHGKRYVYQFMCDIPKILGYDPMVNKCEDFAEDSVCGEPVMSPEVEDLLLTTSVEDGKMAGSLDFSLLIQ
ncbi:protein c-ets-1-B isoform X1 [Pocillopora verrucosa]|uniref:protein c-ets-1-B isoform X1 n=1 Tax=Pocillopora verrucosa TaxID=203993 RepID=UPI00333E74C0